MKDSSYDCTKEIKNSEIDVEPSRVTTLSERAKRILDMNYSSSKIPEILTEVNLSMTQKDQLSRLLYDHIILFNGTLGNLTGEPVNIELVKNAEPVQLKPFIVPHSKRVAFKNELDRLIKMGVLVENVERSWSSTSFLISKNNGGIRFLTDLRKLNTLFIRNPFLLPKIMDLIKTLEGFT